MTDVHIINHTHWDREWFLTHEYTTRWLPPLIESIEKLVEKNPDYQFLLDGQTLAIEDLAGSHPDYVDRVKTLVSAGNLEIGPLYSQPDWRLASGELHLRNLRYGGNDARAMGGKAEVAWLVDTFGHLSQAPQMLTLAGLKAAYVWRGVPQMTPLFQWEGADGTVLPTIDLFGGYRNLYGITKTEDIAVLRLAAETRKLEASYDGLPIPLFDGYDLDTEPEDPTRYYREFKIPEDITLHPSSPAHYARAVRAASTSSPTIRGELLSGKFGATFPGSLSARTYLKLLHHDSERTLHRHIEPLSALAQFGGHNINLDELEEANRTLLQNAVHDAICGVSIDQVHERMERSYRQLLAWADTRRTDLLTVILAPASPGLYAVSTNPMTATSVVRVGDLAVETATAGVGVGLAGAAHPVSAANEPANTFEWQNDHYAASFNNGDLHVDGIGQLLQLVVRHDGGDTYSSEPGAVLGQMTQTADPVVVDRSAVDATVRTAWLLRTDSIEVAATVDARFDSGPVIDFTITLDTTGTDFRVDARVQSGLPAATVYAGMPFDVVERTHDDEDLLPLEIDRELAGILMGQREVGTITEFPFHGFVAFSGDAATRGVLAQGIRSYLSDASGTIAVSLRRSVEWLAATGLALRSGDAGPAMYVPGARSERQIVHRIGFAMTTSADPTSLLRINEAWQNPPILVQVEDTNNPNPAATPMDWTVLSEELPMTGMGPRPDGGAFVHLFNPASTAHQLSTDRELRTITEDVLDADCSAVGPKQIVLTTLDPVAPPAAGAAAHPVTVLSQFPLRVGASTTQPDPRILDELVAQIDALSAQLVQNEEALAVATGDEAWRLEHRRYVLDRERTELELSLELNRRRAASTDMVSIPDTADPIISDIGTRLNDLRVRRRIFDYVVQALPVG